MSPTTIADPALIPDIEAFEERVAVQPPNYVPFFNRVSGTGGLMFRAW